MIQYILRKLAYGIVVMILVVVIISAIIYLAPVDPAQLTFGQMTDQASIELKKKAYGLDQSLPRQLAMYLRDISPISTLANEAEQLEKYKYWSLFSFGESLFVIKQPHLRESYQTGRPVFDILASAIPKTAFLALAAILLATIIGILLGMLAAIFHKTWLDNLAVFLSVLGYSLPSYVTAMIIGFVFAFYLGDWTGLNLRGGLYVLDDFGEVQVQWKNLILPAISLGVRPIGIITQLARSAMLDVLKQDYVRTARSKGLKDRTVYFKHALRNALNPVVTATTGWFAALLAGAFFVEYVFDYDGLGMETITALKNYDIPVVLGTVVFVALVFTIVNILVDILYAFIDPRVRLR